MSKRPRERLSPALARRGIWLCLGLQVIGDAAMIYLANALADPTGHPWPLPHWGNVIILPLALMGLFFAIAGPAVSLRIIGKSPDKGWMKLVLMFATIALSAMWPIAAVAVVGYR